MVEYAESICRRCFHSYVCEQFNEHRDGNNRKCHFFNDHFVSAADVAEVKRGWWIWDENAMDWGLGGWVCSECQEKNDNIPAKPDINPYGWVGSFFCPNCGADMREVDDAN